MQDVVKIVWPFGLVYCQFVCTSYGHLVFFVVILVCFSRVGIKIWQPCFITPNLMCPHSRAVLPDGVFAYQKFQFGYTLEVLGIENVVIFWNR
jgi:hypothetical protein